MKLEALLKRKSSLEIRLKTEQDRLTRQFANLGWGTGMRYSKIPMSYRKEDELRAKLDEIKEKILLAGVQ
jgi:hypothetical protein